MSFEYEQLLQHSHRAFLIRFHASNEFLFRGQFEAIGENKTLIFLGSPWFSSIEELAESGLSISDFAPLDPQVDLLHLIKNKELVTSDLKEVVQTMTFQKQKLETLSYVASANRDGILFIDQEGFVTYVNDGYLRLTGFLQDEVLGKVFLELGGDKEPQRMEFQKILEALERKESFKSEFKYFKRDGSWFWARINSQIVLNRKGEFMHYFILIEDVSEEMSSKNKIVEFEQIYRKVLEFSGDNVYELDFSKAETHFKYRAENFHGLNFDEIEKSGKSWYSQIFEEDRALILALEPQYRAGTISSHQIEYRLVNESGEVKWVKDSGVVIERDFQGIPTRIIGIHSDITEQKNTVLLLEFQEQLKNILIEISSTYINIDLDEVDEMIHHSLHKIGDFVGADRAYIFSYDLLAMTCSCTHEWCEEGISKEIENTQDVPLEYVPQWIEAHKNGSPFKVDDTEKLLEQGMEGLYEILEPQGIQSLIAIPMMLNKELLGFVGFDSVRKKHSYSQKEIELLFVFAQMLVNVQKRKQTESRILQQEEKFRNIISNMNLGLLEVNLQEQVLHANQTFCKMAGKELDELIGQKATDLLLDEESKEILLSKSSSRKLGVSDSYELKYRRPDGEYRWWFISGAPNYNDKNELIGSIGIHLDITGQKRLEEELIKQREDAEKSKRAKEIFFANMSHEIRTPMNAIVGMGEQLSKTDLDSHQTKFLSAIQNSASHLMVIIKDILDLSKLEAGKMTIETIGFRPFVLQEHIVRLMSPKAEDKGLDFEIGKWDAGIQEVLKGDPIRITQILLNLTSNAIKFTESGKVSITSNLVRDSRENQVISFEIEDTGIGMEEEFLSKDFEKYAQEDSTITRKFGGTGLGLNITKELVNLMGGDLKIESQKGVGTRVTVTLTLSKGSIKDLPIDSHRMFDHELVKGKKILVVDDNEFNRLLASTILEQHDMLVSTAISGLEAVKLLKMTSFDLVLMDIQMPEMDGVKATEIIRNELQLDVPVIALTAFAMKGDREKYLHAGMNEFLAKPFQEEELLQVISQVLKREGALHSSPELREESKPPKALYSLDKLKAIGGENQGFVDKMIQIFRESVDATVPEIGRSFQQGEYDEVRKLVHKIKPSVKMLEIHGIADEISTIEHEVLTEQNSPYMARLVERLMEVLIQVRNQLVDLN